MGNLWHVKNWFRVGKNISWKLNFDTFEAFLYLKWPRKRFLEAADRKHAFVLSYLKKELAPVIEKYRNIEESGAKADEKIIWTLWWQGIGSAPPLIRKCIETIERNAGKASVRVITKDNWKDYIDIPDYIREKREKGYISFAQLSDIIRFLLLEKYGGMWLDSTIFVSHEIPERYFERPFFSQHTKYAETCFVQHNMWHGFSIGASPHGKLVSFCREMFLEYWKTHDTLVDYLMIDYVIMTAYNEFEDVKEEIDSLEYTSERLYDLVGMLDQPYDRKWLEELEKDCLFSKLDWHRKYRTTRNGEPTFYAQLFDEG